MSFIFATEHLRETQLNTSLYFQFILSELIDSYNEVLTIQKLLRHIKKGINDKVISLLKLNLKKLAGSSHESIPSFSYNNHEGSLSRLKNYCANLTLGNKKGSLALLKMHSSISLAFISSIESLSILEALEKNKISFKNRHQLLYQILTKIIRPMERFFKIIAHFIQNFSKDENVLFFILKHKSDLAKMYGPRFVITTLKKMYPNGIDEALNFLIHQYTRRGFDHLTPLIQKEFAELKN